MDNPTLDLIKYRIQEFNQLLQNNAHSKVLKAKLDNIQQLIQIQRDVRSIHKLSDLVDESIITKMVESRDPTQKKFFYKLAQTLSKKEKTLQLKDP